MKIDILTLFPEMFDNVFNESIIKRAKDKNLVNISIHNFRDNSPLNNKQVDDTIYGGGPGMLLRCEPIFETMDKIESGYVVLLSPDGEKFNQKMAMEMSKKDHLIFICGHYEGFDERIKTLSDKIVSIGDYVLTGGEIPCMVMVDSITRLIPGVINSESLDSESFNDNYLDYTAYTKPYEYRGMKVPDVLVSGDHKKIDEWRRIEREKKTKEKRPDLLGDD